MTPPALCLVRGFPTARLPSRLRKNLGNEPSVWRPRHVAGERLATVKRHPGYTVWQHCSLLDRDPPRIRGWGRTRKAEYCLFEAYGIYDGKTQTESMPPGRLKARHQRADPARDDCARLGDRPSCDPMG